MLNVTFDSGEFKWLPLLFERVGSLECSSPENQRNREMHKTPAWRLVGGGNLTGKFPGLFSQRTRISTRLKRSGSHLNSPLSNVTFSDRSSTVVTFYTSCVPRSADRCVASCRIRKSDPDNLSTSSMRSRVSCDLPATPSAVRVSQLGCR